MSLTLLLLSTKSFLNYKLVCNFDRVELKEQREINYNGGILLNLLIFPRFALINLMKGAFSILANSMQNCSEFQLNKTKVNGMTVDNLRNNTIRFDGTGKLEN